MKQRKFHYDVRVYLELTGEELHLLTDAARAHYDAACRNFFVRQKIFPNCKGSLWREDFELLHKATPEAAPDKVLGVVVDTGDLGRCGKILEGAHHLGWSSKLVLSLRQGMDNAFTAILKEHRRLNPVDEDVPEA